MKKFRNQKEYYDYIKLFEESRKSLAEYIGKQISGRFPQVRRFLQLLLKNQAVLYGFCKVCNKPVGFIMHLNSSSPPFVPNYRETLYCPCCSLSNRQRFIAAYISDYIKKSYFKPLTIYIYEQVTPFFKRVYNTYASDHKVIGSEYLGFEQCCGKTVNGIRHENALNLSFKNESMDILVSQDVFEHVPDYKEAIGESFRVLKKKGIFIFSIPFDTDKEKTIQRSRLTTQGLVHDLPENYHGNPIDAKGSLVFFDFGWDILNDFRKSGYEDIYLLSYYDIFFGHIGGKDQICFIATK